MIFLLKVSDNPNPQPSWPNNAFQLLLQTLKTKAGRLSSSVWHFPSPQVAAPTAVDHFNNGCSEHGPKLFRRWWLNTHQTGSFTRHSKFTCTTHSHFLSDSFSNTLSFSAELSGLSIESTLLSVALPGAFTSECTAPRITGRTPPTRHSTQTYLYMRPTH